MAEQPLKTYTALTWRLCFYLCSGSRIFSCPDPPSAIPEVDAERPRMDSHLAGKLFIFYGGQAFEWDNFTPAEGANRYPNTLLIFVTLWTPVIESTKC